MLVGCSNKSDEAYNNAIQKGVDVLVSEDYDKAQNYFKLALEEKPEDKKAKAYLDQIKFFAESKNLFNSEDYETAKEKAKNVTKITDGSESLVAKAKEMIYTIESIEIALAGFHKVHDEINLLIETGSLDEALNKIQSLLNSSEINNEYYADIKIKTEELKVQIEAKKAEVAKLAAGPADSEILPNIVDGDATFNDLKNSTPEDSTPLYTWKTEIEYFYEQDIAYISNQDISNYLLKEHNDKARLEVVLRTKETAKKVVGYWGVKATPEELAKANGVGPFNRYSLGIAISERYYRWWHITAASEFFIERSFLDTNNTLKLNLIEFSTQVNKQAEISFLETKSDDGRDRIQINANTYAIGTNVTRDGEFLTINQYESFIFERMTEEEYFELFSGFGDLDNLMQVQYDVDGFW